MYITIVRLLNPSFLQNLALPSPLNPSVINLEYLTLGRVRVDKSSDLDRSGSQIIDRKKSSHHPPLISLSDVLYHNERNVR